MPITTQPLAHCYCAILHFGLGTDFAVIILHKLRSQHFKLAIYKVLIFYAKKWNIMQKHKHLTNKTL